MVLPSKRTSRVKRIVTFDGDQAEAFCPQSVTLVLEDEVDCSRGDMIVRPGNVPKIANTFDATIVWLSDDSLLPGRTYLFKHTSQTVAGQIDTLRYRVDVNTLHRSPAPDLQLNEIGRCSVTLNQPIFLDPYRRNRTTGAFIIIDRITNATVGAGMISDRDTARHRVAAWEHEETAGTSLSQRSDVSSQEREARHQPLQDGWGDTDSRGG
jgi:bifunctional enzyme CysN/CysC